MKPKNKNILYLVLSLSLIFTTLRFWYSLEDPLFNDPYSTVLLDKNSNLIGAKIADDYQWRFPFYNKLPSKYKTAVLTFEDKRFYNHFGVDPVAILRALLLNIKSNNIVSGGSTISMQVIRLSRKVKKRTYFEKFIEVISAIRLEIKYSKEEILGLYAAHVPMGGNIIGIDTASWLYFNRAIDALSWAESALLAILPNSPSLMNPKKNRNALKNKRNNLLKTLYEKNLLSKLEYKLSISEPIPKKPLPIPKIAQHFLETAIQKNKKVKGTYINSSLDIYNQKNIQKVLDEAAFELNNKSINSISAVVIDNKKMEILAYIGNAGKSSGRFVDIATRPRSTGSILKPLLYAAMLQYGDLTPNMLIPDVPTLYNGYVPQNFNKKFKGMVKAHDALTMSLNIPLVRMLKIFGVSRFYTFLEYSGLTTLNRKADEYGLTLILGGAEATLLDLVNIYSNLARVANIELNEIMYKKLGLTGYPLKHKEVLANIGKGAAYLTFEALLEVKRPGLDMYWKNFSSSKKIAWKTGTSFGFRDAWAIGCTPEYTVGVWTGNAGGEGNPHLIGVKAAAPILFNIFNILDPKEWFKKPNSDLKTIKTCKNDGYIATEYCEKENQIVPKTSHFNKITPYNRLIHTDIPGKYRVNGRCESINNMKHISWFIIPPLFEKYFSVQNGEFKKIPEYRKDCLAFKNEISENVINIMYPVNNAKIFIPTDLNGTKSGVIFEAVHKKPDSLLYWHINETYLGTTQTFHQKSISAIPGKHILTIVDQDGNSVERVFKILGD